MKKIFSIFLSFLIFFTFGCLDDEQDRFPEELSETSSTLPTATIITKKDTLPPTTTPELVSTTSSSVPTTSTTTTLALPDSVLGNCIGFLVGAPEETQSITVVGGGWVRPHPGPFAWGWIEETEGDYDFSVVDEYVKHAQANNVGILATVWPYADRDQNICHDSGCEVSDRDIFYPLTGKSVKEYGKEPGKDFIKEPGVDYTKKGDMMPQVHGIPKMRCIPCDLSAYKNFIKKLVERYDGDGVDDMDGLRMPVLYWEILNEPSMQGDDLCFFKGTPAEYVKIL